jgi:hypothetical protein
MTKNLKNVSDADLDVELKRRQKERYDLALADQKEKERIARLPENVKKREQERFEANYKSALQKALEQNKDVTPETVGTWKITGEDPNCDMGGYHHEPSLGLFEGKLKDVVAHAVNLTGFYSWGGGGSIKLYKQPTVTKIGRKEPRSK